MRRPALRFLGVVAIALAATAAQAQGEPVSFAGKQIKLLIGFSPTGYGYDTYGRLLARHLGKYPACDEMRLREFGAADRGGQAAAT